MSSELGTAQPQLVIYKSSPVWGYGGGDKLVRLETLDQNIGTLFVYHNFFDFFISLKENWYLKNPSVE